MFSSLARAFVAKGSDGVDRIGICRYAFIHSELPFSFGIHYNNLVSILFLSALFNQ